MPRKLFASSSSPSPSPSSAAPQSEGSRKSSSAKQNRLSTFFSSSPKTARERDASVQQQPTTTATTTAIVSSLSPSPPPPPSSAMPSLPTISLSGETVGPDEPSDITAAAAAAAAIAASSTVTLLDSPDGEEELARRRREAQFGPLLDESHRYVSMHHGEPLAAPVIDEAPYYYLITTYISYLLLIALGHVRDFFGKRFGRNTYYRTLISADGYAPLNDDFDSFYVRRMKMRLDDCFARTHTNVPGRYITLLDRVSHDFNRTYRYTGTTTESLNMSSYNYLGFAQSEGPCADAVEETVRRNGLSVCSPRADTGTTDLALEVEQEIADFMAKPAAIVFSMGFVTNASSFSALVGRGCLILSDELNHASIRVGSRVSGAVIQSFAHNDMADLERKLRDAIAQGQPRTRRPWKKILVAVEGLYSMEGTMCDLPGLVRLRRRYRFYLFVDEAHSIGAIGPRGRGVCDYFGIDPSEVDILMGTLTKSFGANGGYIAADRAIIDKLRVTGAATLLGESPTPCVLMQILSSLRVIVGDISPGEGEERLQRIAFNSRYLRLGLKRLGYIVYGHDDSPIIPVMLYNPAKMPAFSHEMLRRRIATVVVGYPATPLITSRARFCVSAAHNKDDLDRLLTACDEVGDILQLKFSSGVAGGLELMSLPPGVSPAAEAQWRRENKIPTKPPRWQLKDVIARGVEDAKVRLR